MKESPGPGRSFLCLQCGCGWRFDHNGSARGILVRKSHLLLGGERRFCDLCGFEITGQVVVALTFAGYWGYLGHRWEKRHGQILPEDAALLAAALSGQRTDFKAAS